MLLFREILPRDCWGKWSYWWRTMTYPSSANTPWSQLPSSHCSFRVYKLPNIYQRMCVLFIFNCDYLVRYMKTYGSRDWHHSFWSANRGSLGSYSRLFKMLFGELHKRNGVFINLMIVWAKHNIYTQDWHSLVEGSFLVLMNIEHLYSKNGSVCKHLTI